MKTDLQIYWMMRAKARFCENIVRTVLINNSKLIAMKNLSLHVKVHRLD